MGRRPGRKSGTKEKTIKYFDYTLLFVIIFLVCFGLVMLYSTSSYNAQIEYGDGTHYLKRQAFACCLGFAAMFVVSKIDYHVWKRLYGCGIHRRIFTVRFRYLFRIEWKWFYQMVPPWSAFFPAI